MAFEPEERKGRRTVGAKRLDLACPACGRGRITENERAFGCSRWREGCAFTVWKDCCRRAGGPELTEKLLRAVMEKGRLRGSTGTLTWDGQRVGFEPRRD